MTIKTTSRDAMATKHLTPAPAAARTPENTPLPGGGAWSWDSEACAWVETLPDGSPVETTPTQEA